jgi:hypothetical protein
VHAHAQVSSADAPLPPAPPAPAPEPGCQGTVVSVDENTSLADIATQVRPAHGQQLPSTTFAEHSAVVVLGQLVSTDRHTDHSSWLDPSNNPEIAQE